MRSIYIGSVKATWEYRRIGRGVDRAVEKLNHISVGADGSQIKYNPRTGIIIEVLPMLSI